MPLMPSKLETVTARHIHAFDSAGLVPTSHSTMWVAPGATAIRSADWRRSNLDIATNYHLNQIVVRRPFLGVAE